MATSDTDTMIIIVFFIAFIAVAWLLLDVFFYSGCTTNDPATIALYYTCEKPWWYR